LKKGLGMTQNADEENLKGYELLEFEHDNEEDSDENGKFEDEHYNEDENDENDNPTYFIGEFRSVVAGFCSGLVFRLIVIIIIIIIIIITIFLFYRPVLLRLVLLPHVWWRLCPHLFIEMASAIETGAPVLLN